MSSSQGPAACALHHTQGPEAMNHTNVIDAKAFLAQECSQRWRERIVPEAKQDTVFIFITKIIIIANPQENHKLQGLKIYTERETKTLISYSSSRP